MRTENSIFVLGTAVALGALLVLGSVVWNFADAHERKTTQKTGQVDANFTTMTSAQLAVMLRTKDFHFVNVHTPYEGEIRDTDAFIVYDKIADDLDRLPRNKNEKVVLYCQSGRMSEIAARELVRLGFTRVSHLSGGMVGWKKSGYEIIEK